MFKFVKLSKRERAHILSGQTILRKCGRCGRSTKSIRKDCYICEEQKARNMILYLFGLLIMIVILSTMYLTFK